MNQNKRHEAEEVLISIAKMNGHQDQIERISSIIHDEQERS